MRRRDKLTSALLAVIERRLHNSAKVTVRKYILCVRLKHRKQSSINNLDQWTSETEFPL